MTENNHKQKIVQQPSNQKLLKTTDATEYYKNIIFIYEGKKSVL